MPAVTKAATMIAQPWVTPTSSNFSSRVEPNPTSIEKPLWRWTANRPPMPAYAIWASDNWPDHPVMTVTDDATRAKTMIVE